jgi:uncharacterized protein YbbK (DUF523 family)
MPCRYRHNGYLRKIAKGLGEWDDFLAICPEQMAGLPTPREPGSIIKERFIGRRTNTDYTAQIQRANRRILQMCRALGICDIYLLRNSPACGVAYGLTAKYLASHGLTIHPI